MKQQTEHELWNEVLSSEKATAEECQDIEAVKQQLQEKYRDVTWWTTGMHQSKPGKTLRANVSNMVFRQHLKYAQEEAQKSRHRRKN